MAWTCRILSLHRCAAASGWSPRIRSSSTAPSGRTSPWAVRTPPLEEVLEAARAAELDAFIAGLPERYDTVIGERGANLSGGQRQRLAIARALLRQPELLIFDEATSHLDTATERAIQDSLTTALAGKTVVLVAHRLSTIKEADLIYVLHQGRILQAGTPPAVAGARGVVWHLVAGADGRGERRAPPPQRGDGPHGEKRQRCTVSGRSAPCVTS